MKQEKPNIQEALSDFQLALSLRPPKDQKSVLLKRVSECKDVLNFKSKMTGNQRVKARSHDTSSLAF